MEKDSKLKFLPLLVMLIAAAITALINLLLQVEFGVFVKRLFFSVLIFYFVGYIAYIIMNLALKNEKDVGIFESEAQESSTDGEDEESRNSYEDEESDE
ncbi:MAG: hypothetical protein K6E64_10005 [Lachnospiraceae bacterium]|nr:hypothetical protein [Lachnospiraceae bacterium]